MADRVRRLVFVDDEANILSAIKRELRAWSAGMGLEIATFTSAKDALAFLETEAPTVEVLVSDLRMPEMKGSDFLVAAKKRWPGLPTILLSGYSEAEELMKAVKAGIFSYILKPWDADYLRAELEKAMELRRAREENAAFVKRIEEELRWAGAFQKAFLRPALKSTEGIEAHVSWRPVEGLYCGGDYYDVIDLAPGKYLALIGDVAGHGIKAAFVTGFLKAMIYAEYVGPDREGLFSVSRFLEWLNDRMSFELRRVEGMLVTFLAVFLDLGSMTLRYANAGHCKPWLIRDGRPRQLPASGPAIGFQPSMTYQEQVEPLRKGDLVFMHTDGLVEAGGVECAGNLDLETLLSQVPYGENYHGLIMAKALADCGTSSFSDDVAILTIKVS